MQSEHLQTVFAKEKNQAVYGLPSPSGEMDFTIFQVVSLHPDRRSYIQRAFALSKDESGL